MKLFVKHPKKVWLTGIALAATCGFVAFIVGALHLQERVRQMFVMLASNLMTRQARVRARVRAVSLLRMYFSEPQQLSTRSRGHGLQLEGLRHKTSNFSV
jgi:hypothetical protein